MTERRRSRPKHRTVTAVRPAISAGRVRVLGLVFALVFGAFGYRLVDLQVTPDPTLADSAGRHIERVELPATRGAFVDRHGRPLAVSRPSATVVVNPRLVADAQIPAVVAQVSQHLDVDPVGLTEALSSDKAFRFIQRQVDPAIGDAIMALELPGVWLQQEPRREYPNGDCSARALLGRVDIDHLGISGLEYLHDDALTGTDGVSLAEVSADGQLTIVGGDSVIHAPIPGEDVQLSFDRDVQFKSEQLVAEAVVANGADWGVAIVAIPSTGELIALAGATRNAQSGEVACTTENLNFTRAYEPGSTMKAISIAAVLEAGMSSPHEQVPLEPSLHFPLDDGETFTIFDWFTHTEETYSTTEILAKSSNIGAATLAERIGGEAMYEEYLDFGFGSTTPVDLPGETVGIIQPFTSTVALPTASYGQGVAVSPIQLATAYNVLANGGSYMAPTLLRDGSRNVERQVIKPETAQQVLEMLGAAVDTGTGKAAAIAGYDVAGKTGTAWQPCEHGGYSDCGDGHPVEGRHYTASFVGIVSNDLGAAFTVLVIIDNPRGDEFGGGDVAAPVFAEIASYTARQLRVTPIAEAQVDTGPVRAPVSTLPVDDADVPTEDQ